MRGTKNVATKSNSSFNRSNPNCTIASRDRSEFVDTRQKLNGVDASNTDYLLGLFAQSHVQYDDLRDEEDPSLVDMVKKALEILKRGDNGFFLMVEGARIDHAHHDVQVPTQGKGLTEEFCQANGFLFIFRRIGPLTKQWRWTWLLKLCSKI